MDSRQKVIGEGTGPRTAAIRAVSIRAREPYQRTHSEFALGCLQRRRLAARNEG